MTKLYNHGLSVGRSMVTNVTPSKRGACSGWSDQVARRNMRFLWSIDSAQLVDLRGYAFTWTVKSCPDTPKDLAEALRRAVQAMMRGTMYAPGAVLVHWVIEWQKRGVPHVHGVAYYRAADDDAMHHDAFGNPVGMIAAIIHHWTHQASQWKAFDIAQNVHPVYDSLGWSRYVAKHASRGAKHYQRSAESLPEKWKGSTGRMWGKRGDWPVIAPIDIHFLIRTPTVQDCDIAREAGVKPHQLPFLHDDRGYAAFRRLVRSYQVADARLDLARSLSLADREKADPARSASVHGVQPGSSDGPAHCRAQSGRSVGQPSRAAMRVKGSLKSLSYVRRMLKCNDPLSSVHRGLSRWCPVSVSQKFVDNLRSRGFVIYVA